MMGKSNQWSTESGRISKRSPPKRRPSPLNEAAIASELQKLEVHSSGEQPAPLKLTFGLEFEFCICYRPPLPEALGDTRYLQPPAIVKHALETKGLQAVTAGSDGSNPEMWCCTHENLDCYGYDPNEVLPAHIKGEWRKDWKRWVRRPVELISRRLVAPSISDGGRALFQNNDVMKEIRQYIEALQGTENDWYTSWMPNANTAGLHMHVGVEPTTENPRGELPLPVIQHLAYIIIQFEPLLSSLQPYDRRALAAPGKKPNIHFESNLMGLRRSRHVCSRGPLPDLNTIQDALFRPNITPKDIATTMSARALPPKIHESLFGANVTANDVANTMDSQEVRAVHDIFLHGPAMELWRYKFVNFARLKDAIEPTDVPLPASVRGNPEVIRGQVFIDDTPGLEASEEALRNRPKTIEFRQHEGTFDFEDTSRWVELVIHLVRAAERIANADKPGTPHTPTSPHSQRESQNLYSQLPFPRRQGQKYRPKCRYQEREFERFFDMLRLTRSARDYWRDRYGKCNPQDVIDDKELHYSMGTGYDRTECPVCIEDEEERKKREKEQREREEEEARLRRRAELAEQVRRQASLRVQDDEEEEQL